MRLLSPVSCSIAPCAKGEVTVRRHHHPLAAEWILHLLHGNLILDEIRIADEQHCRLSFDSFKPCSAGASGFFSSGFRRASGVAAAPAAFGLPSGNAVLNLPVSRTAKRVLRRHSARKS
jgi:hypothetical protein